MDVNLSIYRNFILYVIEDAESEESEGIFNGPKKYENLFKLLKECET